MAASPVSSAPSSGVFNLPLLRWVYSSIGKKTIVALTGIALVLFVVGHLLGNLSIFLGPHAINAYGMKLRDLGALLWVARIGLLVAVGLHIYFTMLLWMENKAARPQKYAVDAPIKTTVFARTMRMTGLFVLVFILFHLAHLTLHLVNPSYAQLHAEVDGRQVHDVYSMVVLGFRNPFVSLFYIFSLALVAFHLNHGLSSLFQTLGITTSRMRALYETLGSIFAWALFVGYASIPVAVLVFGLGKGIVK